MSRFAFALALLGLFVVVARPADPPEPLIATESFRRAADADIAFLQAILPEIAATPEKRQAGRKAASKGVTMLLVRYSDWLGDDALKSQAIKVAQKIGKEDWKGAAQESKELKAQKADKAILKAPRPKLTHAEVFAPFRGVAVGGLNIDRDIKDQTKATTRTEQIDIKLAELIGVRTATIIELGADLPPVIGERKITQREWDHYIYATNRAGREVAIEAAKGDKADRKQLRTLLTALNARCTDCHTTDGRDD